MTTPAAPSISRPQLKEEPRINMCYEGVRDRTLYFYGHFFHTHITPLGHALAREGFVLNNLRLRGRSVNHIRGHWPTPPKYPLNDLDCQADLAPLQGKSSISVNRTTRVHEIMAHWLQPFQSTFNPNLPHANYKIPLQSLYNQLSPRTHIDLTLYIPLEGQEEVPQDPSGTGSDDGFILYIEIIQGGLYFYMTQSADITADGCPLAESEKLVGDSQYKVSSQYAQKVNKELFIYLRKPLIGLAYLGDYENLIAACALSCFKKNQTIEKHFGSKVIDFLSQKLIFSSDQETYEKQREFLESLINAILLCALKEENAFDPVVATQIGYHLLLSLTASLEANRKDLSLPCLPNALEILKTRQESLLSKEHLEEKNPPRNTRRKIIIDPSALPGSDHPAKVKAFLELLKQLRKTKLGELEEQLLAEDVDKFLSDPATTLKERFNIATAYLEIAPHHDPILKILVTHILSTFATRPGKNTTQEIQRLFHSFPHRGGLIRAIWHSEDLKERALSEERVLLLFKWLVQEGESISFTLGQKVLSMIAHLKKDRALLKQFTAKLDPHARKMGLAALALEKPAQIVEPAQVVASPQVKEDAQVKEKAQGAEGALPETAQKPKTYPELKEWRSTLKQLMRQPDYLPALRQIHTYENSELFLELPDHIRKELKHLFQAYKNTIKEKFVAQMKIYHSNVDSPLRLGNMVAFLSLYQEYSDNGGMELEYPHHMTLMQDGLFLQHRPLALWHALKALQSISQNNQQKQASKEIQECTSLFRESRTEFKKMLVAISSGRSRIRSSPHLTLPVFPKPLLEYLLDITQHPVSSLAKKGTLFPFEEHLKQISLLLQETPVDIHLANIEVTADSDPRYKMHSGLVYELIREQLSLKKFDRAFEMAKAYLDHTHDRSILLAFFDSAVKLNKHADMVQRIQDTQKKGINITQLFNHSDLFIDIGRAFKTEYDLSRRNEHLAYAFLYASHAVLTQIGLPDMVKMKNYQLVFIAYYHIFAEEVSSSPMHLPLLRQLIDTVYFTLSDPQNNGKIRCQNALNNLTQYLESPDHFVLPQEDKSEGVASSASQLKLNINELTQPIQDAIDCGLWRDALNSLFKLENFLKELKGHTFHLRNFDIAETKEAIRALFSKWLRDTKIKASQDPENDYKEYYDQVIEAYTTYIDKNGAPPSHQTPPKDLELVVSEAYTQSNRTHLKGYQQVLMTLGKWTSLQGHSDMACMFYTAALAAHPTDDEVMLAFCHETKEPDQQRELLNHYFTLLDTPGDGGNRAPPFGIETHSSLGKMALAFYLQSSDWKYLGYHLFLTATAFRLEQMEKLGTPPARAAFATKRPFLEALSLCLKSPLSEENLSLVKKIQTQALNLKTKEDGDELAKSLLRFWAMTLASEPDLPS